METTCILIVDDEDGMRRMLEDYLRSRGYDVVTANNGRDALVTLDLVAIDLILTDLNMPVMNGRELARALALRDSQIPLVVMTATEATSASVREMHAAAFLSKPFPLETLATTVDRVIRAERASAGGPRQRSR